MTDQATPSPTASNLFEAIVRQSSEAIVFADREGVIRIWSPGAVALFGFAESEAIGSSLDIIIPERFRAAHWRGFQQALDRGRTQHGGEIRTTRAEHRDGRKLYVDMSFAVVADADGWIAGSVAIARDCTARREMESALRARIEALERGAGPA